MSLSDDPNEDQVKQVLEGIEPSLIHAANAYPLWDQAIGGLVSWDFVPPSGASYGLHKLSLLDAFATGLQFCGTRLQDEFVICSAGVFSVVRCLPSFKGAEPIQHSALPLIYAGKLDRLSVIMSFDTNVAGFLIGIPGGVKQICRGIVVNRVNHYLK